MIFNTSSSTDVMVLSYSCQTWKCHLQARTLLSLHHLVKQRNPQKVYLQILLCLEKFLLRGNMWIPPKDLVVLHHQHLSALLQTQLHVLQACPRALQWVLLAQKNHLWTRMLRSIVYYIWLLLCMDIDRHLFLWSFVSQGHWQLLFLNQEFKLNPNAKSFTPSTSVRPPQPPASDGPYYYANNMPTAPLGPPMVSSYFFLSF